MKLRNPFVRHTTTAFIRLDTSRCQACWECIAACPNHVIGRTPLKMHLHARIEAAERCKGCKKCVQVCPQKAIQYTYRPVRTG